ncbi:MAG: baseplate J/gp47 family protein, partial [Clostridia bacterium]|nr:baseplate J/gp47 family protein [Clostridia bacterium]
MNDGETHYIDFDQEALWDRMHRAYIRAGGDILYPGDEKEILLRAVQAIAIAVMADVDSALRMDTLTYAMGEYLKLYGEKRFCIYQEAVAATAPVIITFYATGYSRIIEAGTLLTADGALLYELTEDITLTGTAQEINTTVRCTTPGAIGNGLYAGVELQFIQPVDGLVSAVVAEDASGGVDAEDEEAYRERIRRYGLASVTTGPYMLYESQAMAVSTQILDARALNDG